MLGLPRLACLLALTATAFVLASLGLPSVARAQSARPQGINVLAIDSDDADEQADALTNALRSKARDTAGWTLVDTTQTLSMLTAAFQCPQHPDAACLTRIADKLKADHYIWGVLTKAPGHQVTAEVHLWTRGKPDTSTRETFSDNMKDANDDNLRKIAGQIFAKLAGIATGTLVIHATGETGSVVVDGLQKAPLDHGRATITLAAGPHSLEIQSPGFVTTKKDVTVDAGATSQIEVVLPPNTADAVAPGKPLPVRAIVGWSSIGVGVVLAAVGVGFGVSFLSDKSDLNTQTVDNYSFGRNNAQVQNPCSPPAGLAPNGFTEKGCADVSSAHSAVAGEITTLALGGVLIGTGIFLLATDHHNDAPAAPTTGLSNIKVLPSVGPGGGSMVVLGQF